MPFDSTFDWLRDTIVAAGVDAGVEITRGDNVFRSGAVLEHIFDDIDAADIVVAVCTGKNANVFFELGYAWRRHVPVLVARSRDDLPFDVAGYRTVMYGGNSSGNSRITLQSRLQAAIGVALTEKSSASSKNYVEVEPDVEMPYRVSVGAEDQAASAERLTAEELADGPSTVPSLAQRQGIGGKVEYEENGVVALIEEPKEEHSERWSAHARLTNNSGGDLLGATIEVAYYDQDDFYLGDGRGFVDRLPAGRTKFTDIIYHSDIRNRVKSMMQIDVIKPD